MIGGSFVEPALGVAGGVVGVGVLAGGVNMITNEIGQISGNARKTLSQKRKHRG